MILDELANYLVRKNKDASPYPKINCRLKKQNIKKKQ